MLLLKSVPLSSIHNMKECVNAPLGQTEASAPTIGRGGRSGQLGRGGRGVPHPHQAL